MILTVVDVVVSEVLSLLLNVIVLEGSRVGGSAGFFIKSDSFSCGENGLGFAIISQSAGIALQTIFSATGDFVVNEIFV